MHYRRIIATLMAVVIPTLVLSCQAKNGGESSVPTRDVKTVMDAHVDELIQVYVVEKSDEIVKKIPKQLEGHPVDIIESGVIRPLSGDDG